MSKQRFRFQRWIAVCLILVTLGIVLRPMVAQAETDLGQACSHSQMTLDANNHPVFLCTVFGDALRLIRCADPACINRTTNRVASVENSPPISGLTLDNSNYPVFLQHDTRGYDLWLTRCNDPFCGGNNETNIEIDTHAVQYQTHAMVLDAAGNPVIVYGDGEYTGGVPGLTLIHCNDHLCLGSDEAYTYLGFIVYRPSLILDGSGNPVIVFARWNGGAELIHCNDPNCAGGDDQPIPLAPDLGANHVDLELDSTGIPVIAVASRQLLVMRCFIPSCATGVVVKAVSEAQSNPGVVSLELNDQAFPVVTFYHPGENRFKLVYCNDVYCGEDNEREYKLPIESEVVIHFSSLSLALTGSDRPVLGYLNHDQPKTLKLWLSPFDDTLVSDKEWMEPWISEFYWAGLSGGCGVDAENDPIYCPEREVTRAEMAVFTIRALHYPNLPYTPTDPDDHFADVPAAGKEWMRPWIEEFYDLGITQGCGVNPLIFCPEQSVTRAEMAVFILRALEGGSYQPPAASGYFDDVPFTGKEWMEPWIDEFYRRGITGGCAIEPLRYCPERPVTRAEMAVFILRAFESIPNP